MRVPPWEERRRIFTESVLPNVTVFDVSSGAQTETIASVFGMHKVWHYIGHEQGNVDGLKRMLKTCFMDMSAAVKLKKKQMAAANPDPGVTDDDATNFKSAAPSIDVVQLQIDSSKKSGQKRPKKKNKSKMKNKVKTISLDDAASSIPVAKESTMLGNDEL